MLHFVGIAVIAILVSLLIAVVLFIILVTVDLWRIQQNLAEIEKIREQKEFE